MSVVTLSTTTQDYLKVIWALGERGDPVTTKALAERLGVTAATVSQTIRKLVDQGLVVHEPFAAIDLSELGREHALQMVRRHRLLETFLTTTLGYPWDEVHDEAEVLEHAVSEMMIDRIDALLGHPTHDPHGDLIPSPQGELGDDESHPLPALPADSDARIVRVSDTDSELLRYCAEHGLVPGALIRIEHSDPFSDTVRVRVGDRPSIALGARAAGAVFARPFGADGGQV